MTPPIFLMGGGGVGKTTLLNLYIKETNGQRVKVIREVARTVIQENGIAQDDLKDDAVFRNLQVKIAQRQLEEERKVEENLLESESYISDRCALDALVYASQRFPDRFPLLRSAKRLQSDSERLQLLLPLVGGEEKAAQLVARYRKSLIVLVHPFDSNTAKDDGVRLVMNQEELEAYTVQSRKILNLLDIPYLDLKESKLCDRISLLKREIAKM